MESSDVIAGLALAVSVASAYISYRAFTHSVGVHELESKLAFERDKSELLMHVEQSRNLFSSARREIEQLQFVLSHEPPQVQGALIHGHQAFLVGTMNDREQGAQQH